MASIQRILRAGAILGLVTVLAACGNGDTEGPDAADESRERVMPGEEPGTARAIRQPGQTGLLDLFVGDVDPSDTVAVNRYIWNASLEVLDFLPVRSVDPFSGVIVTDYGPPPGGGQDYRATVQVKDPALDARSLNLALSTRAGPVASETVRAVEDAILTRARELRIQDQGL